MGEVSEATARPFCRKRIAGIRYGSRAVDYAKTVNDALNGSAPAATFNRFCAVVAELDGGKIPVSAIAFLQSMPRGPEFDEGLYIVLPNLAKTDSNAQLNWRVCS